MEAYFNELSLHSFTDNETAKNAFLLLGNCLKKLSEMGVSNTRMTDEATRKGILSGQTLNRVLNNEAVIDKDLKSVIINRMCTLEPIDDLENKYNVTGFQYNGEDCKGLGWACEDIEDSVALGLSLEDIWTDRNYNVNIYMLDEDGEEVSSVSQCKHVVTPNGIENLRDFFQTKINIPTNGRVLAIETVSLFPHLIFAGQALEQLKNIKDAVAVEQIYYRLRDLERVAANSIVPISTSIFKYKTTPESETRSRLPEMFVKFEDGETRHCSWHSRFTPGAGRIHFYYDESEKIFYVGYIGEKL